MHPVHPKAFGNRFFVGASTEGIDFDIFPAAALTRWTDAVVGGAVAMVAATLVPRAPLHRPRQQAAVVVRKVAELLRGAAEVMLDGDVDPALALLADARTTDVLIRELQDASDEGLSVVAISYYAVNLAAGVFAPFAEPAGLDKPTLLALLTIPVVVLVWLMVRRIRARLGHRSGDQV